VRGIRSLSLLDRRFATMDNTTLNCSQFSDPGSFYDLLQNQTHFNVTLLSECRSEICLPFIGGAGNPDISGIGVSFHGNNPDITSLTQLVIYCVCNRKWSCLCTRHPCLGVRVSEKEGCFAHLENRRRRA
jgi:hypothetical protein